MKKEIVELALKYQEVIGSVVPGFPLYSRPDDEVEEILKDCINQKKSVYDLGYLPDPVTRLEVMY